MVKYEEIVKTIKKAKTDYYQTGRSELTDAEYDRLVSAAEKLGYIETVGAAPVDDIKKITHEHPMLSLDKCHTVAEIKKFIKNNDVLAMHKADGLTISATYIDGILTRLETRGNGEVGNDIMFHANSIENLPKYIDKDGKYVIDGECVILEKDFETINSRMNKEYQYSNSRNLAAGSLNLLDANISKKRHLRFYAWDVIEGGCSSSLVANIAQAELLGFDVVKNCMMSGNFSEKTINATISHLKDIAEKDGFPIDGIVLKYIDIDYGRSLGMTGHHPKNAIAFKFQDDTYQTKLIGVKYQCGKTGQLTPVAEFEPVTIDNTVINKASLHNLSVMDQLGLTNGCTCYIKKCNMIIPQIDSADPDGNGRIEVPSVCPICGSPTKIIKDNDSEVLYCTNDECAGRTLGKWKTFVSKKGMDIGGLSEQTLDKFLKLGYLSNMFVSVYELGDHKKELYKLDGFGKKSIDNLLDAIEKSKDVDLVHFITAFSIPGIGEGQSKLIAKKYETFDRFVKACDDQESFDAIDGIGPVLHTNILNWWVNNHYQMMDVAAHVRFKNDFMNMPENDTPIKGFTFVVTGSLNHFNNRDALKKKIESLGGKVVGSVSKSTDYLINNDVDSTSSKNEKAKKLGVKIISEEDFLKIIGES